MEAMSYKKFKKSLLMKYPKFNGYCTYTNKKGTMQTKSFKDGNLN